MRAFIIEDKISKFMQFSDIFNKNKVAYLDLDLKYFYEEQSTGEKKPITNEKSITYIAKKEFGSNLILLFGKNKPLYINSSIQVISDGEKYTRLIDVLKNYYENLEFEHDSFFMNIKITKQKKVK